MHESVYLSTCVGLPVKTKIHRTSVEYLMVDVVSSDIASDYSNVGVLGRL